MFILSQIFVGLSLVIVIISILSKTKKNILFYRIPNTLLYAISFALQGLWVAFGNMMINCVRSIVYYVFKVKGKKPNIYVLILFLIILVIMNVILWSGPLGLLPMMAGMLFIWAFWQENETIIRITLLFGTTGYIVYNIIVLNYMGVIFESVIQTFQIIAFIRYDILKKESLIKKENLIEKENE